MITLRVKKISQKMTFGLVYLISNENIPAMRRSKNIPEKEREAAKVTR